MPKLSTITSAIPIASRFTLTKHTKNRLREERTTSTTALVSRVRSSPSHLARASYAHPHALRPWTSPRTIDSPILIIPSYRVCTAHSYAPAGHQAPPHTQRHRYQQGAMDFQPPPPPSPTTESSVEYAFSYNQNSESSNISHAATGEPLSTQPAASLGRLRQQASVTTLRPARGD